MKRTFWGIFIGFLIWICLFEILSDTFGYIFSFFDLWEKTGWQANHMFISFPLRFITVSFYLISAFVAGIFAVKISGSKKSALFLGIFITCLTLFYQSLLIYCGLFAYLEYILIPMLTMPAVILGGKLARKENNFNLR